LVVSGVCKGKALCGGRHMRSSQAWGSMPLTTVPSPEVQHAHREVVLGGADEHSAVTSKAGGEGRGNADQTKHQTRKRGVLHPFTVGHRHRPAPVVAVVLREAPWWASPSPFPSLQLRTANLHQQCLLPVWVSRTARPVRANPRRWSARGCRVVECWVPHLQNLLSGLRLLA
jgi:hypothetical protein